MKREITLGVVLSALTLSSAGRAEVTLGEQEGFKVTTDGRVNAFVSVARGTGIPDGQPDYVGSVSKDTKDTKDNIAAIRIRNGFLTSILGFTVSKQVYTDFKASARVGLWMNLGSSRTKNTPGSIDPRELYGKLEGSWGSVLGGSALSLFGRGGILVDAKIAHDYGLGYPCAIQDASGGACGMAAFGAVFPAFDPGFVYSTPSLGGVELAVGVFDPANVGLAQLNRTPLPRLEGELSYRLRDILYVFASGHWQNLEGTIPDPAGMPGDLKDIQATAWGGQGGLMVSFGPVMVGGAAFMGAGISPITHVEENQAGFDADGVPRKSRGGFGLAAFTVESLHLKLAGGAGVFRLDKSENDPEPVNAAGTAGNPQLLKQNLGMTVGVYQTTGPVHFALEYFRAEHTLYEFGKARPADPTLIDINYPVQAMNFINAGFTVAW